MLTAAQVAAAVSAEEGRVITASAVTQQRRKGKLPLSVRFGNSWGYDDSYGEPGVYRAAVGKRANEKLA